MKWNFLKIDFDQNICFRSLTAPNLNIKFDTLFSLLFCDHHVKAFNFLNTTFLEYGVFKVFLLMKKKFILLEVRWSKNKYLHHQPGFLLIVCLPVLHALILLPLPLLYELPLPYPPDQRLLHLQNQNFHHLLTRQFSLLHFYFYHHHHHYRHCHHRHRRFLHFLLPLHHFR